MTKKRKRKHVPYEKQFEQWLNTARFEHFDTFGKDEETGMHYVYLTLKTQLGRIYLDDTKHRHIIQKIMNRRFNWRVQIIIRCVGDDGQQYVEEREIETDNPVKLNELESVVLRFREDARAAVNSRHITRDGWIAEVVR